MSKKIYCILTLFLVLLLSGFLPVIPGMAQPGSIIMVTTTVDGINQSGDCSLREALLAANTDTQVDACPAGSGDDTILLSSGVFQLTEIGQLEDDGLTGDLDIYSNLKIYGGGVEHTKIDGGGSDRVFHIKGAYNVSLYNLTIQGGATPAETNEGRGGGVLNVGGTLNLSGVKINANFAAWTGGGLDNFGGTVTLIDVTVTENQATYGGGINNDRYLYATRSLIAANHADVSGGGIDANSQSQASLLNVTLSGNSADGNGGGIFTDNIMQLANVTIVHNVPNGLVDQGTVRVVNSLFAQNGDANCAGNRQPSSEGGNLDDDATCGPSGYINPADALIGELTNNEGPTWTHSLLLGSPAIDAGNESACQAVDQRGAVRPADGNGDGIVVCDIGAFELNATFNTLYLPVIQG